MRLAMLASTTVSQGIADCSLKTFFMSLDVIPLKMIISLKRSKSYWKAGSWVAYWALSGELGQMSQLRIQLTSSKRRSPSFA